MPTINTQGKQGNRHETSKSKHVRAPTHAEAPRQARHTGARRLLRPTGSKCSCRCSRSCKTPKTSIDELMSDTARAFVEQLLVISAQQVSGRKHPGDANSTAQRLKTEYPDASSSLLEGLDETFTVNRLQLTPALQRCLCTTNLIENPSATATPRWRCTRRRADSRKWRNPSAESRV